MQDRQSTQDTLEIYKHICEQATHKTISSNDIFPLDQLKTSNNKLIFNVINHGLNCLNQYIAYVSHCYQVSKIIAKQNIRYLDDIEEVHSIKYLSMLLVGIGESDVLAHSISYQILKHNPNLQCSIITIENPTLQKHHFILMNALLSKKNHQVELSLEELPQEAIIIDPYLHFVNKASSYFEENRDFLVLHNFQQISNIQLKTPLRCEQQQHIEQEVENLCKTIINCQRFSKDPIEGPRNAILYQHKKPRISTMIANKRPLPANPSFFEPQPHSKEQESSIKTNQSISC